MGNFFKKNPAQLKPPEKKHRARRAIEKRQNKTKNTSKCFQLYGPIFDVKKFFHKILPTKQIMHNLKARKKFHAPENCLPVPSKIQWSVPYVAISERRLVVRMSYENVDHENMGCFCCMKLKYVTFLVKLNCLISRIYMYSFSEIMITM